MEARFPIDRALFAEDGACRLAVPEADASSVALACADFGNTLLEAAEALTYMASEVEDDDPDSGGSIPLSEARSAAWLACELIGAARTVDRMRAQLQRSEIPAL